MSGGSQEASGALEAGFGDAGICRRSTLPVWELNFQRQLKKVSAREEEGTRSK